MGKSRLVAEFVRDVRRAGQTVAFGECQAYGTKTPYFVWREIWRRLFGLNDDDSTERQIAALRRQLAAIDRGLEPRTPLLAEVVGLSIPDSDLTRGFDAKLRKTSLEDLLAICLRARSGKAPVVAVLEDCHWIDELSRDLLEVLIRSATSLPVLFVLAYRPTAEPGGDLGVAGSPGFSELALDRMEADDVARLVRSKMQQLLGGEGDVSDELVELVAARSEGNPFYVEELLNFIVSQGVDARDPAAIETVRLPDSLHTLVLSRIDAAAEGPRRTMKVASVVGRVFEAKTLPGAYRELGDFRTVLGHLDALRTLDLVALDREADQAWMFKHVVTQEVAYESLPFALRAVLHGLVGDYIERTAEDDLDRHVPLLEHHYWRSDREDKKRDYLQLAAEAAQASYANNAAIAYYDRLLTLVEGRERVQACSWDRARCSTSSATGGKPSRSARRPCHPLRRWATATRRGGHWSPLPRSPASRADWTTPRPDWRQRRPCSTQRRTRRGSGRSGTSPAPSRRCGATSGSLGSDISKVLPCESASAIAQRSAPCTRTCRWSRTTTATRLRRGEWQSSPCRSASRRRHVGGRRLAHEPRGHHEQGAALRGGRAAPRRGHPAHAPDR